MGATDDHPINHGRRRLLRLAGLASALAMAGAPRERALGAFPKETGLSFEGLLKDQPGFQPRRIAPAPYHEIPRLLSKDQLGRNYAVYHDDFARLVAAENALANTPRNLAHAREYAAFRRQQVAAGNSVLLHEFYFRNLAAAPAQPTRYVVANMNEHMGSLDDWREDFAACARIAGTWAALVYDPYDDRWHNVALGDADAGGWVGANPLLVCDVADHAWSLDYKDRDSYVARFLAHIDWSVVAARYRAVDRH